MEIYFLLEMQTIYGTESSFDTRRPIFLTLGMFDGMHLGHLQLIRQLIFWAKSHGGFTVVLTFDRHPRDVVDGGGPPIITPLNQKLYILSHLGIEGAVVLPFTDEISQMPAEEFIRKILVERLGVKGVLLGFNNRFGHKGEGNFTMLRQVGAQYGIISRQGTSVSVGGRPLSSTVIRDAVSNGRLVLAEKLLGRKYSIFGRVVHGRSVGRKLGFPTANLEILHSLIPPCGVYSAVTRVGNDFYPSAVFIGPKELVEAGEPPNVESHIIGIDVDLYGREIEVVLISFLRHDVRFADQSNLIAAIRQDVRNAYKSACEVLV